LLGFSKEADEPSRQVDDLGETSAVIVVFVVVVVMVVVVFTSPSTQVVVTVEFDVVVSVLAFEEDTKTPSTYNSAPIHSIFGAFRCLCWVSKDPPGTVDACCC
jgi:hypothetical protein